MFFISVQQIKRISDVSHNTFDDLIKNLLSISLYQNKTTSLDLYMDIGENDAVIHKKISTESITKMLDYCTNHLYWSSFVNSTTQYIRYNKFYLKKLLTYCITNHPKIYVIVLKKYFDYDIGPKPSIKSTLLSFF